MVKTGTCRAWSSMKPGKLCEGPYKWVFSLLEIKLLNRLGWCSMDQGKFHYFLQCRSRCMNVTNTFWRGIARIQQIWSLRVIYCRYLSLAYNVLEFQAGGPDVWHDTQIKIKQLGLFLPSCAHMCLLLMCAIKGRGRIAFRVLTWRVSNSRAATYPVPLVRASLHSSVIN